MRIGRIEKTQGSLIPSRHISIGRANRFIARGIAKWLIVDKLLKMLKDDGEIRGDAELIQPDMRISREPRKRTRWNRNLLLYYPHKDQASHGILRRRQEQHA